MARIAVINVVGLTRRLLGMATPNLNAFCASRAVTSIAPVLPAVTCAAQATYLTGKPPTEHGIVGNGWYNRELAEVQFWKQSNHLVQANKVWELLRRERPGFTCAKLFWWHNMYSSADWSITPRPMYPADGRKVFDIYAWPYSLRPEIKRDLGEFPFPGFWGPAAGVKSPQGAPEAASRWIAEAAKWIESHYTPDLNLVYLPHLDYNLQRLGPSHLEIQKDLQRVDAMVGDLLRFFDRQGVGVRLLSEYGITPVTAPIHLNRLFRARGWLAIKEELGLELLDAGASQAFAVADHQVAHVYVNNPAILSEVRALLESTAGVEQVLDEAGKQKSGLAHPRAGDLVAIAREDSWFTYYYWQEDGKAPDFARTVDIHRKPGYDPVELFLDPATPAIQLKILWRLLQKKLRFRMLMDVIPLDAGLVKGSHGCRPKDSQDWPVLVAAASELCGKTVIEATDVCGLIQQACLRH
ncbi:MAG: nucleotide pyrophosphatase/phosphodiesterase family protein [Verrucomicrobiota bacterium]